MGSKSYKLKDQTKTVDAGERTILKLKPKSSKDARRIAKAIKKYKKAPRKKKQKLAVKAPIPIAVEGIDAAANSLVEKRVVGLK